MANWEKKNKGKGVPNKPASWRFLTYLFSSQKNDVTNKMLANKESKQSYITLITSWTSIYTPLVYQCLLSIILTSPPLWLMTPVSSGRNICLVVAIWVYGLQISIRKAWREQGGTSVAAWHWRVGTKLTGEFLLRPQASKASISMREVIIVSIL